MNGYNEMKTTTLKITSILGLAVALAVGIPTLSRAAIELHDQVTFLDGPGANGGIFHATEVGGSLTFDTFCTETGIQQYINFNDPFEVVALGLTTSGNMSADSSFVPRTLQPYVAWAYHEFLNQARNANDVGVGGLSGFVYSGDLALETASANSLQELIWTGLSPTYAPVSTSGGTLDPTITDQWLTNFNNDVANGDWTGTGDVQIMQLVNVRTGATAQDQLVEIPGSGNQNPVPEANSLATWSLLLLTGVMGLTYRRR